MFVLLRTILCREEIHFYVVVKCLFFLQQLIKRKKYRSSLTVDTISLRNTRTICGSLELSFVLLYNYLHFRSYRHIMEINNLHKLIYILSKKYLIY